MSDPSKARSSTARLAWCLPGVLLQLGGLWWAWRTGWDEVNLLIGAVLFALGTPLCMVVIERHVVRLGRPDRWALVALLGPLAPLIVARLDPGGSKPPRPLRPRRSTADRVVGMLLIGLCGVGLLWAAERWILVMREPDESDPGEMSANESQAYERLLAIAAAQEQYRQADRDGDGQRSYAAFYIHLWRSVAPDGTPVPLELISRELGFAMVREFALDGYVYESLHTRALAGMPEQARRGREAAGLRALDPQQEWAVVAKPAVHRQTGRLELLIDSSGAIWCAPARGLDKMVYPDDPEARGWTKLTSVAQLTEIGRALPVAERRR